MLEFFVGVLLTIFVWYLLRRQLSAHRAPRPEARIPVATPGGGDGGGDGDRAGARNALYEIAGSLEH